MSTKVSTTPPPINPASIAAENAQVGLLNEQTDILRQQQQTEKALMPAVFASSGLQPTYDSSGNLVSVTQSPEAQANMELQQQVQGAAGQYYLQALQGKIPDDPLLLQSKNISDQTFQQYLANNYGQGGQISTGAQQAQNQHDITWQGILENARRGNLALGNQLNATGTAGITAGQGVTQTPVNTIASLLPGIQGATGVANSIFSGGLSQAQLGLQTGMARNQALNAFWGDIAGGAGAAAGAFAGMV